jgi:uncharacterized protein (DUF433 family)
MLKTLTRITFDPETMGGKPCIRGMRVTVGTIVGLLAAGRTPDEVLGAYPYLERADIYEALAYAAWRVEEVQIPDGTRVLVTILPDNEREFWLQSSQVSLNSIWDSAEDDVYAQLLQKCNDTNHSRNLSQR